MSDGVFQMFRVLPEINDKFLEKLFQQQLNNPVFNSLHCVLKSLEIELPRFSGASAALIGYREGNRDGDAASVPLSLYFYNRETCLLPRD